jgi:integrase
VRARKPKGSVVFNRLRATWNFLRCEGKKRRSYKLGTLAELPTRADALKKAEAVRRDLRLQRERTVITVKQLVAQYRAEKMPVRASTRRGYEAWLANHVLPHWSGSAITELQPRPVELWLASLPVSPKSKLHIRGLLSILWDFAMWRGDVPTQRNPMELVSIRGASNRTRKPRSLNVEHFQLLLAQFEHDVCFRTMLLLAVSFGLRISEVLGLKWCDVDWLGKTLRIERGVVKQVVDDVKSAYSARTMAIADELLEMLKLWRQTTQFSAENDWMFASPVKLGRQPISYTFVWETLRCAAMKAGIGHISSHCFRHTYRSWLDSVGTPVGVQQKLMRHSDVRTTLNLYGDAFTTDMRQAHDKVVRMALPAGKTEAN